MPLGGAGLLWPPGSRRTRRIGVARETGAYSFGLFDRTLVSEIDLPLLAPVPANHPEQRQRVVLTVEDQIESVRGDLILGSPELPVQMYADDGVSLFSFREVPLVAIADVEGARIVLRPTEPATRAQVLAYTELIHDRLVTSVLSRIPILWGTPSVHGAVLLTPQGGAIAFLGKSGVGKSTLSQNLAREYGWTILDDDSFLPRATVGATAVIPMGGSPRLLLDAADTLGLRGIELPGFSGKKIALSAPDVRSVANAPALRLIIELFPDGNERVDCERLTATESIPHLWEHVFTTNFSRLQRALRFEVSKALASSPVFRVRYRKADRSPIELARLIGEICQTQW